MRHASGPAADLETGRTKAASRPRFAGVVFDLDGTLIHSAPDIAAALNIVLEERGIEPFPVLDTYRFVGAGARRLIEDSFAARGQMLSAADVDDMTAHYLRTYARNGSSATTLYPGVVETIASLRRVGLPLAVCTNKAEGISKDVLRLMNIGDAFSALIGGDSGYGRKPEPGPLVEVCRRMGVAPRDILMVGDTVMDVGAAQAVGAQVAVVRYGYSQKPVDTLGADYVIDAFAALTGLTAGT
jgi:phosphoglycolate phosphatase